MRYDFISLWILIILVNSNKRQKNSVKKKNKKLFWTKNLLFWTKQKLVEQYEHNLHVILLFIGYFRTIGKRVFTHSSLRLRLVQFYLFYIL